MGKGSKWRKTDFKKYFENWSNISRKSDKIHYKKKQVKQGKTTYNY